MTTIEDFTSQYGLVQKIEAVSYTYLTLATD